MRRLDCHFQTDGLRGDTAMTKWMTLRVAQRFRIRVTMQIFNDRIARVQQKMQSGALLVLAAAPHAIRNRDTHFPYRGYSDTLYLTGINEEELALIITNETLFIFAQTRDPERERWVGKVCGHEFFRERFADAPFKTEIFEARQFERQFAELAKGRDLLYFDFGLQGDLDRRLFAVLHEMALYSRKGERGPRQIIRASEIIHELRLFKDAHDIDYMRKAAAISSAAHNIAMTRIESADAAVSEYEIKALIEQAFMAGGAERLAYPSIVAAGVNATILHYERTQSEARLGDFVLIDAGAECEGYASDITRTTAAGGWKKASKVQKDLYDLVLASQKAAIAATQSGTAIEAVHTAACDVLSAGLFEMGFFKQVPAYKKVDGKSDNSLVHVATLEEVREGEYLKHFYMHRTSHYLGLDVHDVGEYYEHGKSRNLQPGMVITVEPGLYFPAEYEFIPAEARGIGIRIEDDVLVSHQGNEVLTAACRA